MRNVNHFVNITCINQDITLETGLPRLLGFTGCLGALGLSWEIVEYLLPEKAESLANECLILRVYPARLVSCRMNLMTS